MGADRSFHCLGGLGKIGHAVQGHQCFLYRASRRKFCLENFLMRRVTAIIRGENVKSFDPYLFAVA
jgi:hypothetical protein